MELKDVVAIIEDVRDEYQRQEEQALLQKVLDDARWALAGKDACDRIQRRLQVRYGMDAVVARVAIRRG